MSKETLIKAKVLDHITIQLEPEDGTPEDKWPKWKLCYNYRAIAQIEESTGLDLKNIMNWEKITSSKFFPQVIHGGLAKFNPDVTLDQVLDVLNPAAQQLLARAILELMFPGVHAEIQKLADKETGATASPNVPVATNAIAGEPMRRGLNA
jgi:hypothetical protein